MDTEVFSFDGYRGKLQFVPGLEKLSGKYVVWWWGGLRKNPRRSSVPLVSVAFKKIDRNGKLGSLYFVDLAATYLVFLPKGTVVESGRCIGYTSNTASLSCILNQKVGSYQIFGSNFTKRSFFKSCQLPNNSSSEFLVFGIGNKKKVIIPCLVYFFYCYGFSPELKRILLTYEWEEILRRICGPVEIKENSNTLVVNLPKRLIDNDAVFVAHTLYDEYAHETVKSIYAQLEVDFKVKTCSALVVKPWYQEPMQVELAGKWLDEDTFLTFYFLGVSEPNGDLIEQDRQNTNKVKNPNKDPDAKKAWGGIPKKVKDLPLTILHSDYDPNPDEPAIEITEPTLKILGKRRERKVVIRENAKSSPGKKKDKKSSGHGSSGEPSKGQKPIGRVSQNPDLVEEYLGTLLEMWNAAQYLSATWPKIITSVEWVSSDGSFSKKPTPDLIEIPNYTVEERDEIKETAIKNWVYIDPKTQKLRGILVIRMVIDGKEIFISEIERRNKNRAREENFQGIIFQKDDDLPLIQQIFKMTARIRNSCGVMSKVLKTFKIAHSFNHNQTDFENVQCENAIINAFKKMRINDKTIAKIKPQKPIPLNKDKTNDALSQTSGVKES